MSGGRVGVYGAIVFGWVNFAGAQQTAPPVDPPQVLMSHPPAILTGTVTRVVLRGKRLDETADVRIAAPGVEVVKIIKKEKNPPPEQYDAARAGDSRVEAELRLFADAPAKLPVAVVDAQGRTATWEIAVLRPDGVDRETEPNDGFKQARPLDLGRTVLGEIQEARNVDVYRIEPFAGRARVVDVVVSPSRSLLDPAIALYAADGRLLATHDDEPKSGEVDLRFDLLPADAVRYLVVYDANDRGGPTHGYLLRMTERP